MYGVCATRKQASRAKSSGQAAKTKSCKLSSGGRRKLAETVVPRLESRGGLGGEDKCATLPSTINQELHRRGSVGRVFELDSRVRQIDRALFRGRLVVLKVLKTILVEAEPPALEGCVHCSPLLKPAAQEDALGNVLLCGAPRHFLLLLLEIVKLRLELGPCAIGGDCLDLVDSGDLEHPAEKASVVRVQDGCKVTNANFTQILAPTVVFHQMEPPSANVEIATVTLAATSDADAACCCHCLLRWSRPAAFVHKTTNLLRSALGSWQPWMRMCWQQPFRQCQRSPSQLQQLLMAGRFLLQLPATLRAALHPFDSSDR
eukprot:m.179552 g.179552  ORF g.179552 m.179552 type:complete len:317 (-) comp10459_c1_seq15:1298-2248(-)